MAETKARPSISELGGVQNFREVTGYHTLDGRTVRRNKLWRSATLHELSDAECGIIIAKGIKVIADLRGPEERIQKPTPKALHRDVTVMTWDSAPALVASRSFKVQLEKSRDRDQILAMVAGFYRKIAEDHAVQLRDIYLAIASGSTPILIHCAAGKDRTGITIAFLLELLGVDREQIFQDYEMSERLLNWDHLSMAAALGLHSSSLEKQDVPTEVLELLMRSDRAYLSAAFGDIEERYGSVELFCQDRLSIDALTIGVLRDQLLQ